jgi:hypothetical protein
MSDIALRLKSLHIALQQLARTPDLDQRDQALIEEAQHACDVGTDLIRTHRVVQARYACFYGEACVALIQSDMRSAEMLRRLLREDLVNSGDTQAGLAS